MLILANTPPVLSVRFEVGVSLLLAPARADKKGPKAPFPLVVYAGIQPAIQKRVPARAPVGSWVLLKALPSLCSPSPSAPVTCVNTHAMHNVDL